jgi:transcriptional regulator with XRE-family HTH domain
MSTFSVRLKELRESNGYNQEQLAQVLGVGATTISRYENGSLNEPGRSMMLKLRELFSVTLDYLNGLSDDKYGTDENKLLHIYRKLSDEQKRNIFNLMQSMGVK